MRGEALLEPLRRALLRGRLTAETRPVRGLDEATRRGLWDLYRAHYERVDEGRFFADLDEKDDVILLRDAGDRSLQGFTTLAVYTHAVGDAAPVAVLFSGDTVITPGYQRQRALHRAFVTYAVRTKLEYPGISLYWFLISKGYKTYLLLSRNFVEYWPRWDRPTPPADQALLDALARRRFGGAYDPARGVVRFDPPGARLREGVAPVDAAAREAPDVRFFLAQNPGHADGDELACLGRIDLAMVSHFTRRVSRAGAQKALASAAALFSRSARARR